MNLTDTHKNIMTDEKILQLAKTCGIFETDSYYWECWEEQLLKFARAIREDAYQEGFNEGTYQESYHNSIQ